MTDEHRVLREQLGAYALGDLEPEAAAALLAHLDGCPECQGELAEIAPLRADLALVDVGRLTEVPVPPALLGDSIRRTVADERRLVEARTRRRGSRRVLVAAAASLAVLTAGIGAGFVLDRPPPVPLEVLALERTDATSPQVESAGLVPHTWGVEVRLVGSGFDEGEVYRAAFRSIDGRMLPAGEFLGIGQGRLVCNLQAALLRDDSVAFVVMDEDGMPVLETALS